MLKNYLKDESGQFAIMFAVFATMLLAAVGVSIEANQLHSVRSHNQALADAAVLAAAGSGETKKNDLEKLARESVKSMMSAEEYAEYDVQLIIQPDNTLRVLITKDHEIRFLSAFNNPIEIKAVAEAPPKGQSLLNIALVLDVTDSMEGDKLTALKDAASNLVATFDDDDASSDNPVNMSVVPFARYVKLPMTMAAEPWLSVEAPNLNCWDRLDLDASEAAGVCVPSDEEGEDWDCSSPVYYEHCEVLEWDGCVASRVDPWHTRSYVGSENIHGFAGGGGCPSELLPLTDDLDDVLDAVDNLYTYDETYIPSGLMWGWRTLTPEAPLTEANTDDYDERRNVLILMTDGENSRSYGGVKGNGFPGVFHWEHDIEDANDKTADACADIKLSGIEIYTVAFEVTDSTTLSMLQNCASAPAKFFDASNAVMLESAFETIGEELAQVRLSR
ncbi:MAG: VWA domain-containing protein [Hellea sp.]|nr:VWA domain-containing protein [Hellea sp.]